MQGFLGHKERKQASIKEANQGEENVLQLERKTVNI
jgi:hypothetical protein